jgi:hypothetical protein
MEVDKTVLVLRTAITWCRPHCKLSPCGLWMAFLHQEHQSLGQEHPWAATTAHTWEA